MSKSIEAIDLLKYYILHEYEGAYSFYLTNENGSQDLYEYKIVDHYENNEVNEWGNRYMAERWKVFYFPDFDAYVKVTGYYTSHAGLEFDDNSIKVVKPETKTITVWS